MVEPAERAIPWLPHTPTERTHHHLWQAPDGTGLHAPWGTLVRDDDSRLACHLCGRWWTSLGAHVRVHGYTAATYREAMGLRSTVPLVAAGLSGRISARQRIRYDEDEDLRVRLATGHAILHAVPFRRRTSGGPRPDRERAIREALDRGRQVTAIRRAEALRALVEQAGHADLGSYLRTAYAAGASLQSLAETTGLGRQRLRKELADAGVPLRASGRNTPEGKRTRMVTADRRTAEHVGCADIRSWLSERRAEGWSLRRLADETQRSVPWVSARLSS